MKTKLHRPASTKARYDAEYGHQALEHWRNSGRSAARVAAELGILAPLLSRWARRERLANAGTESSAAETASVEHRQAEIRRLREENVKLLEKREVLRKSLGILCGPPPRGMPKSKP